MDDFHRLFRKVVFIALSGWEIFGSLSSGTFSVHPFAEETSMGLIARAFPCAFSQRIFACSLPQVLFLCCFLHFCLSHTSWRRIFPWAELRGPKLCAFSQEHFPCTLLKGRFPGKLSRGFFPYSFSRGCFPGHLFAAEMSMS